MVIISGGYVPATKDPTFGPACTIPTTVPRLALNFFPRKEEGRPTPHDLVNPKHRYVAKRGQCTQAYQCAGGHQSGTHLTLRPELSPKGDKAQNPVDAAQLLPHSGRREGTRTAKHCPRDTHNHGTELAMKVVRQARLELSGGSTPDQLTPPPPETKGTIVGKNEIYKSGKSGWAIFLYTNFWVPDPPLPPPLPLSTSLCP